LTQLDCLTEPDDIIHWAAVTAGNDAVIGIDAPTVVPSRANNDVREGNTLACLMAAGRSTGWRRRPAVTGCSAPCGRGSVTS
jgi:hypothetical protein